MNSRIASTLPALSFLLLLGGCPIWTGGETDPGTRCDLGDPCPVGYTCAADGYCVYDPYADGGLDSGADASVPDGSTLDGSTLDAGQDGGQDAGLSCRTDGDCAAGFYCDDTTRVCAPSSTCSTDAECTTATFVCDFRDTCVPLVSGACRSADDCSGTEACIEGFCRAETDYCAVNTDCGASRVCLNGACTDLCFGGSDETCGSGQACVDGYCRADTSECSASAECEAGEYCVGGRCLPDCESAACADADDVCGDDSFCRPDWTESPFCSGPSDCASGSDCVSGVCRTPCPTGTDEECTMTDPDLAVCASDNYCRTAVETSPECRLADDCGVDQDCLNATCRAS